MSKRAKSEKEIQGIKQKQATNKEIAYKDFWYDIKPYYSVHLGDIIRSTSDLDHPYTVEMLDVQDPKDIKIVGKHFVYTLIKFIFEIGRSESL